MLQVHQFQSEQWADPLSGQKMTRLLLGSCVSGRLILRPCVKKKSVGSTDLLWIGNDASGAFDYALRMTIVDSWQRLKMYSDDIIAPRPLPTKTKHLHWLARLPPAIYMTDESEGGCSLYQLKQQWVRRPV